MLCFGELLWDLLADRTVLGGAPFNCAYRLHSLGDEVAFASRVGDDELGSRALTSVRQLGVPASLIQRDSFRPTGTVNVSFGDNREPAYDIVDNVAYDHIVATDDLLDSAALCECFCFGTLVQRSATSRATLARALAETFQALKVYDVNLREGCFSAETVAESLDMADVVKLNGDEVRLVQRLLELPTDRISVFCGLALARWRLDLVVVTLGANGVYAAASNGDSGYIPGYRVAVADPVGSGDAFTAGLAHSLLAGKSPLEACEFANALGALVATTHGGTAPVAPDAIEGLRGSSGPRVSDTSPI